MEKLYPPEKILADNLNRLMEKTLGLDSEAKVAKAFNLFPWQLLVPDLDPANPPILALSPDEKALYERLKAAAKAIYKGN